jgi:hypothetical protein
MQFKVQNNAAQCNAVLLQCNTCSRLKTSVNSVHLGPGGHFFQGGAQAARLKGCKDSGTCRGLCRMQEGECVFCREASSAGGELKSVCHLQGSALAGLRTSSTSVPGACRGLQSDVLLS